MPDPLRFEACLVSVGAVGGAVSASGSEPARRGRRRCVKPVQPDGDPGSRAALLRYAGMGSELAAGVIGCIVVGWWIGRALNSERNGLVIGAIVGSVGGLYNFLRRAIAIGRAQGSFQKRAEPGESSERPRLGKSGASEPGESEQSPGESGKCGRNEDADQDSSSR